MSARQELARVLEQWLELTHAEAGAIQSAAWPALAEIQSAKAALQTSLAQVREKWQAENPSRHLPRDGRHAFQMELSRLISLETRNEELLAAQVRRARAKRESLNEAARNLRKIQRSYSAQPRAALDCYS